jgi:excisionase family DNA binding protein
MIAQARHGLRAETRGRMHEKTPLPSPLAVSIQEACRLSGLGRTKIYELISDGRLTPIKVDRRTLIRFASLEKLVNPDRSAA